MDITQRIHELARARILETQTNPGIKQTELFPGAIEQAINTEIQRIYEGNSPSQIKTQPIDYFEEQLAPADDLSIHNLAAEPIGADRARDSGLHAIEEIPDWREEIPSAFEEMGYSTRR